MKKVIALSIFLLAIIAEAEPLTLTWSGGDNGNLSEAFWSGGEEGHLTPQNGDTLVFPKGGSFANNITGLKVAGLKFSAAATIELRGEEKITILSGGFVRTIGTGAVSVSLPLQVGDGIAGEEASAEVVFAATGASRKLEVSGPISGSAPISVGEANGTVIFSGDNTFTGKLSVTNGLFEAKGKNALGLGETEKAYFKTGDGSTGAKMRFVGVTVPMPVSAKAGNVAQELKFGYVKDPLTGNAAPTKFTKDFIVDGAPQLYLENWSAATFAGKFQTSSDVQGRVEIGGTLTFKGEGSNVRGYIVTAVGVAPPHANSKWPGTVVFSSPLTFKTVTDWHGFGVTLYGDYGVVKTTVENAFPHKEYGWNPLRFNKTTSGTPVKYAVLDMNGKSQTFSYIRDDAKQASNVIKSDSAPCVLRLMQNWSAIRAEKVNLEPDEKPQLKLFNPDFFGEIRGKVSVSVEGSDTCFFSGPNTSTGSFSLTNEAYCGFTETGVWKGKEFFVSAGSTLVVSNTAALLATSKITLSDDSDQETKSSILLGEGNYTADSMSVDGELLYRGTWGSSQSNARFKDDVHFKGPGVLTLNKGAPFPGLRLIVK